MAKTATQTIINTKNISTSDVTSKNAIKIKSITVKSRLAWLSDVQTSMLYITIFCDNT